MKAIDLLHIAYQEDVEIEPIVTIPIIHMIEYDYGPFIPPNIAEVPLFVALMLKKSSMCRIRTPKYLEIEYLDRIYNEEVENKDEYISIYPYIFELYLVFCEHSYNMENREEVKRKVKDIQDVRLKKTKNGIKMVDGTALNLNNLTAFEYNQIKEYLIPAIKIIRNMRKM
ncbi:DNA replication complex GINS protein PSF2 [Spraguea lophii 42_110]|uniref:DNA replication complex GINS protein PSF2 n=1 Tax=Spraguea lophii (strain 42_110) TaxID=1358809 RepID=S7XSN4_SPRLO|nr:DNA replication complex GINS protein PSF2 [Spraguea lophii 42_110]